MTWFITLQNYTVSEAVGSTFKLPYIVPSLLYVLAIYVIIIGGVKKVGVISSYMTPVMCLLYIVGSLFILITNYERLPEAFVLIFKGAFTTQAAVGGFLGAGVATAMRLGFARSVYSNEAGWGNQKVFKIAEKVFILGTPLWGLLVTVLTLYGNGTPAQLWVIADFTTVFPTFVNVATLFILSGTFIKLLKDYKARYLGIGKVDKDMALFYEDKKAKEEK